MNLKKKFRMNGRQKAQLNRLRNQSMDRAKSYIVREFFRETGFDILRFTVRATLLNVVGKFPAAKKAVSKVTAKTNGVVRNFFGTLCEPYGDPGTIERVSETVDMIKAGGSKAFKAKIKGSEQYQAWTEINPS